MVYFEGKTFELPKKTMALNDIIESINSAKTSKESYYLMFEFLEQALGLENIQELLETTDINEMDLVKMNLLCNHICSEYDNEVTKKRMKDLDALVNSKAFEKVIQTAQAIERNERTKK